MVHRSTDKVMGNLFEELEKNRKPYVKDKLDIALMDYRHEFKESYPLPFQAKINVDDVINDIYERIKSGKKKYVKPFIEDGKTY